VVALWGCQATQQTGSGAISAPAGEWTWVAFADAKCANGSATGLAVNPKDGATDVVIYLMGGGACWDWESCYGQGLAWNVTTGYGPESFDVETTRSASIFDRGASTNPFKDASYVFIPYCTGDVHVGTAKASYGALHVGAKNLDVYLARLAPTFASAQRVLVVGTSAGGFGAQMNAGRFVDAFGPAKVHVMADSAALVQPAANRWATWTAAWQPQGCDGCDARGWVEQARAKLGGGRLGVVSAQQDWLISAFTGLSGGDFQSELGAMVDAELRTPTSAAFVVSGSQHVFFQDVGAVDGLSDWLAAWRDGTAGFTTRTP